ncbi:TetR/AcrR family transcriptional regulator [Rheinheimera texasensis]|uniref:TetR/AcrR family transcriptional regulator n=1 Tax=Rheinheimera texasensis TaxID=306205 RepID=UPI0032B2E5FD
MSPQPPLQNSRSLARQQREQALLKLAQQILRQDGFAGLTMDRLTALSDVSKGTLYNHFSSKEDVLTALSVDSLERLQQLFRLALGFSGHSRERALALHHAYHRFSAAEPTLFLCLLTAATPGVMEKSSPERLQRRQQLETELLTMCQTVLAAALADGSLTLPAGAAVEQYAFINWALAFGCNALFAPLRQLGLFAGLEAGQINIHSISLLFDGMGWLPLSPDWDYQASWQRINHMFSQQLTGAGSDSFIHPMLSNAQEHA